MKYKTAELTGVLLNAAVARLEMKRQQPWTAQEHPPGYSTHWVLGGPIIEREQMTVTWPWLPIEPIEPWQGWNATVGGGTDDLGGFEASGPTPLIAAMRAYVASKLGEEIEMTPEGNPDPRDSYYRETNPHVQAKIAAMQADRVVNGQIVRTAEAQRVIDEMDALIRAAGHKWGMFGAEQHWKPLTPGEPPNPFYSIGGA